MDPWVTETTAGSFIDVLEEEFRKAANTVLFQNTLAQILFNQFDLNLDGSLERSEIETGLKNMGYDDAAISEFWEIADLNRDGNISLDEFISMWTKLSP